MKAVCLIPVVLALWAGSFPLRAELADDMRAIVNDTVISESQVLEFASPVIEGLRRQYADQPAALQKAAEQAIEDSLQQLIERQLILHSFELAEAQGASIPETVIEDAFQQRIRERFGDRATMVKTLQAQGMTVEQYRKDMRDQFIEGAMRYENVSKAIIISPYKVEAYYRAHLADFKLDDQVKLRMITLSKNGNGGTNTYRMASEILGEIKGGASFPEMARIYSQDSEQRQGGDRGWVDRTVLRKELADAAFALKRGQTSPVIDLPDACYLLHVDEVSSSHVKSLADERLAIEKILKAEEEKRLEKQWIASLRAKTFVQLY